MYYLSIVEQEYIFKYSTKDSWKTGFQLGKDMDVPERAVWEFRYKNHLHKPTPNLPKCSECGSKNVVSKGIRWYCKNCGKSPMKVYRSRKQLQRPDHPCPKCNSIRVKSSGAMWNCSDCGKSWSKKYNSRNIILHPEHPCPDCGSIHVHSGGGVWLCNDCGRSWRKFYKGRKHGKFHKNRTCPQCGKHNIITYGKVWKCFDCKKQWRKKYYGKGNIPVILEKIKAMEQQFAEMQMRLTKLEHL